MLGTDTAKGEATGSGREAAGPGSSFDRPGRVLPPRAPPGLNAGAARGAVTEASPGDLVATGRHHCYPCCPTARS